MRNPIARPGVLIVLGALLAVLFGGAVQAAAEEHSVDDLIANGRTSYLALCGSCHGIEGKGEGLVAPYLKSEPPDLTKIASRNQGVFPFEDIYDIVDGREVPGHGTRAMPVWGPAFLGMEEEMDKKVVKEKIVELVYYLKSIQPALPLTSPKMGGDSG